MHELGAQLHGHARVGIVEGSYAAAYPAAGFQHHDGQSLLPQRAGGHQARSACSNHDYISHESVGVAIRVPGDYICGKYSWRQYMADSLTPLSSAILFALADGASHGYAIIKEIEALTDGEMRPNTGSLYLALHRLLEDGMIVESAVKGEDARRRYYKLSEAGREAARAEA